MQWRDLPERFSHWKTVYNRFHRWAKSGRWEAIFKALRLDVDELGSLADASVVRAHQGAAGGKRGIRSNALGRSRGGFSTKVHAVPTTGGKPLHLALTAGQQHESTMAEGLLVHAEGKAFIADTGYDADRIRANVRKLGMKPVIHSNPSRKRALPLDRPLYRLRYRVECFFHDLKRFRAVATRCCPARRIHASSLYGAWRKAHGWSAHGDRLVPAKINPRLQVFMRSSSAGRNHFASVHSLRVPRRPAVTPAFHTRQYWKYMQPVRQLAELSVTV